MTASETIAIIGAAIATVASLCAVITFLINRAKSKFDAGANETSIKADIKYMRNSFDELRLDVKEISRKQDSQSERVTRCEESIKSAHKRLDNIIRTKSGGADNG